MTSMNSLFKRRVAAGPEDGKQSPSMSPQLFTNKIGGAVRTLTGRGDQKNTQTSEETRQDDLERFLSGLDIQDEEDDDWRNDFLSPRSAVSKGLQTNDSSRSAPRGFGSPISSEHSSELTFGGKSSVSSLTESLTSSESSNENRPARRIAEPFTGSPTSSDRLSVRPPRHVRKASYDSAFPVQARTHYGTVDPAASNGSPRKSHRRSNTFTSNTKRPSHRRSSSAAAVPTMRRSSTGPLSLESLQATLQMTAQASGSHDFKVGQTWNLIGNYHFRRQEHSKAVKAYERALVCKDGCEKPSDSDHIAAAYGNIATVCWSTGDLQRSIDCLRKALELRIEAEASQGRSPDGSLIVATSYHQLGMALSLHHDYDEAMAALMHALQIQERVLGKRNIDVARTHDAIGKVHLFRGEANKSMECHQKAYAIKCQITGERDPSVISSLMNIAAAHVARQDYEEAIVAYLAVRNVQTSALQKAHDKGKSSSAIAHLAVEAGETNQILVGLFTKTNAYQNAELAVDDALQLYQQAGLLADHPNMQALKESVMYLESTRATRPSA